MAKDDRDKQRERRERSLRGIISDEERRAREGERRGSGEVGGPQGGSGLLGFFDGWVGFRNKHRQN